MSHTISMLIADDSHIIQQMLSDAARASKLPLRLSATDNGRDCLTLLNGSNIDLAFIDVHMPELSGTQAFWSAKKIGIKTFVTLMSNPPATEAVEVAIKLQAYEFLFKPFTADDALAIIKTYARVSAPTKVLIVDDSSSVRQIVQKIVRGSVFNCVIEEAGDGETALTLCRASEYDVVFLDWNMPGLSGLATMKLLSLLQPSLRIVMMSSEHNSVHESEALESGASAFLHKPFNSQDVDNVLHAAFGLRSPNLKVKNSEQHFDVASRAAPSGWRTRSAVTFSNICGTRSHRTCAIASFALPAPAASRRTMSRRSPRRWLCSNCVRRDCSTPEYVTSPG
jgi:DNA-binding NtrC family response regulator